jgi:transcription initiation factor TFIID subunit 15
MASSLVKRRRRRECHFLGSPAMTNNPRDPDNFINFCQGQQLTNGAQVTAGSCNGIPMGRIPASANMISAMITNPQPGKALAAGTTFNISVQTSHLAAGKFTNPTTTYYTAPQDLDGGGDIIGHCHVTVQDIGSLDSTSPPDPSRFVFFKGIDDAGNGKGLLQAEVSGGLPAGTYRVCTMIAAQNHQPVAMPVAQRGAQDDCTKFEVTDGGGQGGGNQNQGQAGGNQKTGGNQAGGTQNGNQQNGNQNQAGGNQSGGAQAGGNRNQAGGNQAGGNQAGGNQAGGNQAGGNQAGGNQAGGKQSGGAQAGSNQGTGGKQRGQAGKASASLADNASASQTSDAADTKTSDVSESQTTDIADSQTSDAAESETTDAAATQASTTTSEAATKTDAAGKAGNNKGSSSGKGGDVKKNAAGQGQRG